MLFQADAQLTFYLVTGIPISRHVGGVACGLVTSSDAEDPKKPDIEQYRLITDILVSRIINCRLSSAQFKIAISDIYIFCVYPLDMRDRYPVTSPPNHLATNEIATKEYRTSFLPEGQVSKKISSL